jgi:SAM-dependent methyltransferase
MSQARFNPVLEPRIGKETMSSAMAEIPQYYRWMFERFVADLGDTVLDVGTGPGIHLPFLERRRIIAIDLSAACLAQIRRRFPWVETIRGDICDSALADCLTKRGVDTITCLNVLEHIREEGQALGAFYKILLPRRGRLVLVVPAHDALYGSMDHLACHFRRYSLHGLLALLEAQGFSTLRAGHFNCVGGVAWYLNAKLLPTRDLSAPTVNCQIRIFGTLLLPLARIIDVAAYRLFHIPFGQSLIAVATPRV